MVLKVEGDFAPLKVEGGWMPPGKRMTSVEWHLGQRILFIMFYPSRVVFLACGSYPTLEKLSKTHKFMMLTNLEVETTGVRPFRY